MDFCRPKGVGSGQQLQPHPAGNQGRSHNCRLRGGSFLQEVVSAPHSLTRLAAAAPLPACASARGFFCLLPVCSANLIPPPPLHACTRRASALYQPPLLLLLFSGLLYAIYLSAPFTAPSSCPLAAAFTPAMQPDSGSGLSPAHTQIGKGLPSALLPGAAPARCRLHLEFPSQDPLRPKEQSWPPV